VQAFYGKTPFRDKGKLELPGKGVPKLELGNKNSDSFPNWSLGTRTPTRSQTGAWGQELRLVPKLELGDKNSDSFSNSSLGTHCYWKLLLPDT